ncbi:hypothetical protein A3E39_04280 [Candidatus Uhrbacteria bacterium RIFCSPHIGHO2_12_FULL_60_25]|uniref:Uncharacterized protein n=1 Tax=Candidatus Uhrbacteria bacterium RIFCSPHIGHO2_12_FULL_60_25 TaxID=1802399 RepID=A0A1F7UII0_9BACT|nr:MAG: hypothetical protein A3D73_00830 [Candidatus Uhrbacteria bacterium RIFCSPHIGHO2_02_FULL_60_44]OGL78106.1 MAG: hypothetical protein A3E39_04280 [Candidatus Uhrbacteria bacterium RIFCSPHIGHO2_12_FULL_60_25]
MTSSSFECFGVRVDGLRLEDVIKRVAEATRTLWIVTLNPEILLEARRNIAYRDVLNRADMRIVDGVGLLAFGRLRGSRPERTTGVDLAQALVERAASQGQTVAFVGGEKGIREKALAHQTKRFPTLKGIQTPTGTISLTGQGDEQDDEARHRLSLLAPEVILVALGHPKQEFWISRHINEFPTAKVIVGIGGTFDYWSGAVPRAPRWMRTIGLEWLFRLIREPKRFKRIVNAVVLFPVLVMVDAVRGRHRSIPMDITS